MNIDLLRKNLDAVNLPETEKAIDVGLIKWANAVQLCLFAREFLNPDPITPEWLRDVWPIKGELEDGKTLYFDDVPTPHNDWTNKTALVMVSFKRDTNQALVYALGYWVVMNQGQFTALMFSLGIYPKQ